MPAPSSISAASRASRRWPGRFLEEDASLDAVRASLLDARADAEPQITPHHPQPGPNPTTRPWGDVIARTFKLKG